MFNMTLTLLRGEARRGGTELQKCSRRSGATRCRSFVLRAGLQGESRLDVSSKYLYNNTYTDGQLATPTRLVRRTADDVSRSVGVVVCEGGPNPVVACH